MSGAEHPPAAPKEEELELCLEEELLEVVSAIQLLNKKKLGKKYCTLESTCFCFVTFETKCSAVTLIFEAPKFEDCFCC